MKKTVVLIGLMGAGKSRIGRFLAEKFGVPFVDSDAEIEAAALMTIPEIFERLGEAEFRRGEQRVILRILQGEPVVLATGGGAFLSPEVREMIAAHATSVWLKADLDVLVRRTGKSDHRPLLRNENPRAVLEDLIEKRYPVYAKADIVIETDHGPARGLAEKVYAAVQAFWGHA